MAWFKDEDAAPRVDPTRASDQRRVERYIEARARAGESDKDIALEVSDRFGVVLTPGEVKDIKRSGW